MQRLRLLAAIGALIGALVVPAGTAAAATTTPYGVNLLLNPGAEQATNSDTPLPHWSLVPTFERVPYLPSGDTSGFPTQSEAARISGGNNFFSCGQGVPGATATQSVVLQGRSSDIDAGSVGVSASAQIATYPDGDYGTLSLYVSTGGTPRLFAMSDHVANTNGVFQQVSVTGVLPAGATRILVVLTGVRKSGYYCDAYFDNVSLVLTAMPASALNANLAGNGGAEQAPTAGDAVPSWMADGAIEAKYGARSGYPSRATATAIGGGKRFFTCNVPAGEAHGILRQYQTIYGLAGQVNAGALEAVLTLRLGTRNGSHADFVVLFQDAWSQDLTTRVENDVMAAGMKAQTRTYPVPAGATRLEVYIQLDSASSATACRSFVDNVSVTLQHV